MIEAILYASYRRALNGLIVVVFLMMAMYALGVYSGYLMYRPPTAHVEVQSNPKEAR